MKRNEDPTTDVKTDPPSDHKKLDLYCDRCGARMKERQCKISCPNCGHRFDCSDLNIHFD